MAVKILGALILLSASACVTHEGPQFTCIRGVVFVETAAGLSWLPGLDGRPVSCVEFGEVEYDVPDEIPASVR